MAGAPKSSAASSGARRTWNATDCSLELKPAELEALLEKPCSCSTLRVNSSERARRGPVRLTDLRTSGFRPPWLAQAQVWGRLRPNLKVTKPAAGARIIVVSNRLPLTLKKTEQGWDTARSPGGWQAL